MGYQDAGKGKLREAEQIAAIADLTPGPGTADGTIADVGAAFDAAVLNNNFADLTAKVNAILAGMRNAGILAP